jgi:2-methylisocitrate lyase-like PEP mutase family enzyme
MVEGGKTPIISAKELEKLGYKIVIYPNTITRFYIKQSIRVLGMLKSNGSSMEYADEMMTFKELNELLGLPEIQMLEKRYSSNN